LQAQTNRSIAAAQRVAESPSPSMEGHMKTFFAALSLLTVVAAVSSYFSIPESRHHNGQAGRSNSSTYSPAGWDQNAR
jgi:hypothetical protein